MKPHHSRSGGLPELLAPAGNIATALAAYQSGADAVYFGLEKYNARIPAENFSIRDLSRIAAYAKGHGKKYYLTFNTLIKQDELEDAARQLEIIARYEPDALIVQDIGIVRLLRELFPAVPVHASTQMGIHNSAGVNIARDMGIERIILERQVTLQELESIVGSSPLEIEVFIHGALCCSLSGRCLFSSWIGGWSGNRGRCKQPCRRRYYSSDNGGKKGGFYFSTQDLYTLDLIPELKRIGVDSLKIEGRLKKPDYVQNVVSAYRMMIDAPEAESDMVLRRAKLVLSGSFGRRWSHGFASTEDMKTVLQPDSVGVSGLLIGKAAGFQDGRLRIDLSRKLHVGDRIRVQTSDGQEGPSFTVRGMEHRGREVKSCSSGPALIPVEGDIPSNSTIYKISQSVKRVGPPVESLDEFVPRAEIGLQVSIARSLITVKVHDAAGRERLRWTQDIELEEAQKHSIDPDEVKRVFNSAGNDSMRTGRIDVQLEPDLFMPPSLLKQLRREFQGYVAESLKDSELKEAGTSIEARLQELLSGQGKKYQHVSRRISSAGRAPRGFGRSMNVDALYSFSEKSEEVELPHFCSETALDVVRNRIARAVETGIRQFRVTDLYQFELLRKYHDLEIRTGFPLPVSNSLAVQELADFGAGGSQAWIELDRKGIEGIIEASSVPIEIYRYGRPFILATRAKVSAEGMITDPRGKKFLLEYSPSDKVCYLYPIEILRIPEIPGTDEYWDFRKEGRGEKVFSSFNFDTEYV
ncbi:MAG: U32 family peptidase [Spirochaetota bacterium]|nr:U32 family peptidase [Spirochaetota bacterium]